MITYLIQMIACSGVLYAYYHFFLRNEKFHQYNRFYLLIAMALSLTLPLLKIPVTVRDTDASPVYAFISTGEAVAVAAVEKRFDYGLLLYVIYGCIVLWMLFRLVKAILEVIRIKQAAHTEIVEDIRFVKTPHPDAPFSFFKWLFWNERIQLESMEGIHMFKHEMYHIRSKHSRDLLFMEIIVSICWFNPFFYLYRKEVKTIQEFLADQHAAADSDTGSYAELLLMRAIGNRHQQLINPFFHNQLKRRITMLTSSKKPQYQWLRKLLVLPVATTAIALFAFTYEKEINGIVPESLQMNKETGSTKPAILNVVSPAPVHVIKDTIPAKAKDAEAKKTNTVSAEYLTGSGRYRKLNPVTIVGYTEKELPRRVLKEGEIKVDVEARYPGNWANFLERNINGQVPTEKGAPAGKYEAMIRFIVNEDGSLSDFEPISNEGYGMEDEVIRILKKSEKWYPAINNKGSGENKNVKSYRIQPVNFQVIRKAENSPKNIGIVTPAANNTAEPEVFTRVEQEARYDGNWMQFLSSNLNAYIPVEKNAPAGNYTTIVQFIVAKDGTLSNIKTIGKPAGYGMDEEAIRVIKASGKWKPAIQNGREVKAYRKQPITFQISLG